MTTNVPCPTWIDQLIDRKLTAMIENLRRAPDHAREYNRGQINALEQILDKIRMSSIQSEK
jgi:hypothetical protein